MASALERLKVAKSNLIFGYPFFGTLAMRLELEEDPKVQTGVADGKRIRFNPNWIDELTDKQCMGFLAHITMHMAMLHHTRRGMRDKKIWNQACDFAINPILKEANFELPNEGPGFFEKTYANQHAEAIYTILYEQATQNNQGGGQGSGSGQGSGDKESKSEGGDGNGDEDKDKEQKNNTDPGGNGEVEDSPNSESRGASSASQRFEEQEWKVAVQQAATAAKSQGSLPGALERFIEDLEQPQIPWRELLRQFMTERSNDDFSWSRPNRRFIANGLHLPSRYSEGSGEIICVIDTSGSIGNDELNEFGTEIISIVEDAKPSKLRVIYCDSRIAHIDTFRHEDEVEFALHGGGGTDFRPPFKRIEKEGWEPKCVVYLTDGYGPFPDEAPGYPVMWVINNYNVTPPWGEHLIMDTNG